MVLLFVHFLWMSGLLFVRGVTNWHFKFPWINNPICRSNSISYCSSSISQSHVNIIPCLFFLDMNVTLKSMVTGLLFVLLRSKENGPFKHTSKQLNFLSCTWEHARWSNTLVTSLSGHPTRIMKSYRGVCPEAYTVAIIRLKAPLEMMPCCKTICTN